MLEFAEEKFYIQQGQFLVQICHLRADPLHNELIVYLCAHVITWILEVLLSGANM
jgi:putative AlgH/UPF0301 family transcriptional regulator